MSVNPYGEKPSFLRSLLSPSSGLMILLSVGLHSAIAIFPIKEAPEPPEQAIVESLTPLTVTRLPKPSPIAAPDITDTRPIAPPQPVDSQPAPQIVISQPILSVEPEPEPLPVMAEPPSDISSDTSSDVSVENTPDEGMPDETAVIGNEADKPRSPQFNEAEVAAMAAVWEGFLGNLQGGLSGSNLQQILSAFGEPEQEAFFFDANQQPRVSVVSHHLLEAKTPEQVFEEIVNPGLTEQEGFEVREYGEFAGGPVYEVVQGGIVHYLNIVPLSVDSILIVCDRPPGA